MNTRRFLLQDTSETNNRTADLLAQRREDTAQYESTASALRAETSALRVTNRNLSTAAAAVRPKLASLLVLRDAAQRALEAMTAEIRADSMDAEELAGVRAVSRARGGSRAHLCFPCSACLLLTCLHDCSYADPGRPPP
jgi:septal ring factor EnvC (AmiA/AmiB activator)